MIMIYTNENYIYLRTAKPFYSGSYDKMAVGRLPQFLQIQYFIDTEDIIDDKYYGDTYQIGTQEAEPDEDDYREMIMDNLSYVYHKLYNVDQVGDEDYEEWFNEYYSDKLYGIKNNDYDPAPPLNGWDVSRLNDELFKTDNSTRSAVATSYIITYNNEEDEFICNSLYLNDLNTYGYPENVQAISDGRETWRDNVFIRFKQYSNGEIKVADYFTRPSTIDDYRERMKYYVDNYADELFFDDKSEKSWWLVEDVLSQPCMNSDYSSYTFKEWFKANYPDRHLRHLSSSDWVEEVMNYQMDFDVMYLGLPQYGNGFFFYMDRLFKEQGSGATVESPLGLVRVYEFEPDDPFDYGNTYLFTPSEPITLEEDIIDLDMETYIDEGTKEDEQEMKWTNDDFEWLDHKKIYEKTNPQSQKNIKRMAMKPELKTESIILEEGCTFRKGVTYCLSKEGLFVEGKDNLVLKRLKYEEHLMGENDDKDWYAYYYPDDIGLSSSTKDLNNVKYLNKKDFP